MMAVVTTTSSSVNPFLRTGTPCMKRFHGEFILKGMSGKHRERQSKKPSHQAGQEMHNGGPSPLPLDPYQSGDTRQRVYYHLHHKTAIAGGNVNEAIVPC